MWTLGASTIVDFVVCHICGHSVSTYVDCPHLWSLRVHICGLYTYVDGKAEYRYSKLTKTLGNTVHYKKVGDGSRVSDAYGTKYKL